MRLIDLILFFFLIILSGCEITTNVGKQTYVCLTFDDQHHSIFTEAYPILEQHDLQGTLFINSARVGIGNRLSWDQIDVMVNGSGWETGGHTLNHVNLPDLTYEESYEEIYQDYINFVNRGLPHNSFALPSGHATEEQFDIISEFYENIRTSMNLRHYAPINRRYLGYLPFQTGNDSSVIIGRIIEAVENKEDLVILGFHSFDPSEDDEVTYCNPEIFQEIVDFIVANEFEVLTLNQACELLSR
jgi:peptidoglycan/xylan/chitin deacetylase (PgdA/CDA1 family)